MMVETKTGIYSGAVNKIRVGHRRGKVLFCIDDSALEFKTPEAFKLGWDIVCKSGELQPQEYVSVKINGKVIELLQEQGLKVGGALLRKCDDADDFQRVKL